MKIDYFWPRAAVQITAIVFLSQVLMEAGSVAVRKHGFEWVTPACGVAFALACLYAAVVVVWNALEARK
jgi:hypothetical protein